MTTTHESPRNPMPELAPVLKQLRLSGILESIERRNLEAIEHKMTYPEFLALVIQDEAGRRDQKKYGTRLRRVRTFEAAKLSRALTSTSTRETTGR